MITIKVIKRNGSEAPFDQRKIKVAIEKASNRCIHGLSEKEIDSIVDKVTDKAMVSSGYCSVEDISDMVEAELVELNAYEIAKAYIKYRYERTLARQKNTTDDKILAIVECDNEEVKQENANKNPTINSVQRDYIAGEVSRDITERILLPPEIVEAHKEGIIHFHDSDFFIQHMHNCELSNLEDMLQNGTVISGVKIDKPHSFSTACNIASQTVAAVCSQSYGGQTISLAHLAPFVDVSRQKFKKELKEQVEKYNLQLSSGDIDKLVEDRVAKEINRGVQTLQYQLITMFSTNGLLLAVVKSCEPYQRVSI